LLKLACLIRALGVELLLLLDRGADLLFLKTNRGYRIPSRPEAFPMKVSLPSTNLARDGNGICPLIEPITSATAYFGGIRMSMGT